MNYRINFLITVIFTIAFTACHRDKTEDTSSPAHHIHQSEMLTIPLGIELPSNLPNGNSRVATFYAEGVQKYKAQIKAGTAVYEWVLTGPQADLYNDHNQKVGTHGAGPFWQLSPADSIFAQAYVPAKTAPAADANSVDWLLLTLKTGKTPTGIFSNVSYIQRIDTRGGKAPATPPSNAGETVDVRYSAIYRFTKKNS